VAGTAQGHARDKDGKLATSKLNEPLLKQLSEGLQGRYERVTQDDGDIARIADYLATFEREQFEERKLSEYHDQYPYFLAVTWVCLLLEWLL
jgi:Ca-activated chloride channel family protein